MSLYQHLYYTLFLFIQSLFFNSQKSNSINKMQGSKTVLKFYGPTKIKDGLFMGDQLAAHDLQWIAINQITHVINCVGKQVKNLFQKQGISYLTFPWNQSETQILFDTKDVNIREVLKFIQDAQNTGGGVLIHSRLSDSRSCCIISAYFMKRFGWNLLKTLQFLNSRKEDIELEPQFFQQLNLLQNKLARSGQIKSQDWQDCEQLQPEQLLIRNTFLNAKQKPNDDPYFTKHSRQIKKTKIVWRDKQERNNNSKIFTQLKYSSQDKISNSSIILCKKLKVKSILKGSNKIIQLKPQKVDRNSEDARQSRNKSSKSIIDKDTKKKLAAIPSNNKINARVGSEKSVQNKQNLKDFYEKSQQKSSQPIKNSIETIKPPIQTKNSSFKKIVDQIPIQSQSILKDRKQQVKSSIATQNFKGNQLTNNWVIKTDLKNYKDIQQQILKKQTTKPVIILKPNLNVTIMSNPDNPNNPAKRPSSQKKKQLKSNNNSSTQQSSDVYLKVLKQRMVIETNKRQQRNQISQFSRKQRSNSAKSKLDDNKNKQRQLFTISNLMDMQTIIKPKWKR